MRFHSHRIHFARPAAVLAAALATLAIATPVGAEPCSVEVSGLSTPAWRDAASSLRLSGPAGDCASLHLEILEAEARLTFTTRDGRRAERLLTDPAELEATIAALRVTDRVADSAAEPSRRKLERRPPNPTPALGVPAPRGVSEQESKAERPRDARGMYSLQAGSRGGADDLISPVVSGTASLVLDRWELGVVASFDFQYFVVLGTAPEQAPGSAIAAGVTIGRREQVGNTALLAGIRLMIAGLNDEREVDTGERGAAEVRTGGYFGLVLPTRASTRFRTELGAELVPHDLGGPPADASHGAMTPWWAVSLLAGVELGG